MNARPDTPRPARLALAMAGVVPGAAGDVRAGLDLAASLGLRSVQLDATWPETRPRLLGRSARRDLASALRRRRVALSGVDLWIPPEHFTSAEWADRAMTAAAGAAELVRDLVALAGGAPIVSTTLAVGGEGDGAAAELAALGASLGVRIADHAWPARESPADGWLGVDPASVLAAGGGATPAKAMASNAARVATVRVSDAGPSGRTPVGEGGLDLHAFIASASVIGAGAPLVVDARGLADPLAGAARAVEAVGPMLALAGGG